MDDESRLNKASTEVEKRMSMTSSECRPRPDVESRPLASVHPADLLSFGRIAVPHPLEGDFGRPLSHYVAAPDERLCGVHFWAYPAL